MCRTKRSSSRSADQSSGNGIVRTLARAAVLAGSLALVVAATNAYAQVTYRSDCQVVEFVRLESFGHNGSPAQLSHFTCRISGGPMHGSSVTGTNIWDMSGPGGAGILLGSIAIAQRPGMKVMYEVHDATRHAQTHDGKVDGWQASSWGIYKSATGSAALLAGKTFTSTVHYTGPRTFVVENTINQD